jgi:CRP/FNR family cyclic AMP-dependent transcriptional regulator
MMTVFARLKREWSISDVARVVRTHERFSMLNEADAVTLVQHMHPIRLSAGETLFREGRTDANSFMAVVLEGQARAETDGGGLGEKIELGVVNEGDLVGEQGILQETPRSATVTASTDMVLAAIDHGKFDRLIKAKPALGCSILISLLRTVTLRLSDANQRVYVLEDSNKKLRNDLSLEISSSRTRQELKEIPPMDFTNSMFEPPDKKK